MKTEISRNSLRPGARYSGVYLQQGRMITDADWNEQADVARARLASALLDLVGRGAPGANGAIDGTSGTPQLQWGKVYADGVAGDVVPDDGLLGQPFNYNRQADYPDTRSLPSSCVLYADVWDRTVSYIEDDELRDPALNGADTTTRTRRMAQIKWCSAPGSGATPDCLDESVNPTVGDGELTVSLRESGTTADDCDPCATEIVVSSQARNYLFRLEVHDVVGLPSNPDRVVLKWSGENGAEARSMADAGEVESEPGFATSSFAYEFYDQEMDLLLGVDLSGRTIGRGDLRGGYPAAAASLGRELVRRWDGFCTLVNDGSGNWTLEDDGDSSAAFDLGTALSTSAGAEASGHVDLTGGTFSVNLESLVLELALVGHRFVAGDYWLAVIRESADSDRRVTQYSTTPTGVVHHYVELVRKSGSSYAWLSDAHRRRNTFPAITDLDAGHVSYDPPGCANGLFNVTHHDTVQRALDALCDLNATHVAFEPEPCDNALFDSSHDTVQKALKALCALQASHVAFENCPSDPPASPFHGMASPTVQEALERLCDLAAANVTFTNCSSDPETSPFHGLSDATVQEALERLCALTAASVTFENCDTSITTSPFHGLPSPVTVQSALEALCGLGAGSVTYAPPSDCTSLAGTTTVEEALNALCDVEGGDNCGARLRLFGRGIICGVIPDVSVNHKSGLDVPFTVSTTAGTAIDGWGCVVDVGGLTVTGKLRGFRLTSGPFPATSSPLRTSLRNGLSQVKTSGVGTSGSSGHVSATKTNKSMTTGALAELEVMAAGGSFASRTDVTDYVKSGNSQFDLTGMSAVEVNSLADAVAASIESSGAFANASLTSTPVTNPAKRWVYLVLPKNGDPRLEIRTSFAGHVVTASADVTLDTTNCTTLKSTAWAPYEQVGCASDPSPGTEETAVCVGTLGLRGSQAWVCPDDREAILMAPIRTQALETRDRAASFDTFNAACGPTS